MKSVLTVLSILTIPFLVGCAGTPKAARWNSPAGVQVAQVFDAATRAVVTGGFTISSSDRTAGVISARKQEAASAARMAERTLNVRMSQDGDKVAVTTTVHGSSSGVIEGSLGGVVNKELAHNFYVYLFRELNINDPSQRQIEIEDAK